MVTANDLTCRIIKLIKRNHQNFCIPIYLHVLTAKIKNNNKELRKFPYTLKMWRTASTAIYGRILLLVCQQKKRRTREEPPSYFGKPKFTCCSRENMIYLVSRHIIFIYKKR